MLKYFPLHPGPMQEHGSSLLRLIQNDNMIPLDLLVRESVQNSLDASIKPLEPVSICFNVKKHFTDDLAELLPEIAEGLRRKFDGAHKLLEIRDTGTHGLTGPLSLGYEGETSRNFVKLVYEISQPQEKKDAGGSWGLGKTVYYRMGGGLVFYYSRIRKDTVFEDRLAVCFVENESLTDRVMSASKTGIAWWGGENFVRDGKEWPCALKDRDVIEKIIFRLGVSPFAENETGTSVIIPFLRQDLLPQHQAIEEDDEAYIPLNSSYSIPWYGGISGYIKYSLLKWYAVRISNDQYPLIAWGSRLDAYVDGVDVSENLPPLYSVIQALFNQAHEVDSSYYTWPEPLQDDILIAPITLRGKTFTGDYCAGSIAAVRLTREQLGMGAPDNENSPFTYLLNKGEDSECVPIIGYLRSPGMIISWNDEKWLNALKSGEEGKYIIALFVPYSAQLFSSEMAAKTKCEKLEEYLRSVELADHSSWVDKPSMNIVQRITKGVQKEINDKFFPVSIKNNEIIADLGMSRLLADAFLPKGFGQDSRNSLSQSDNRPDDKKILVQKGTYPVFTITDLRYKVGSLDMSWSLYWGKKSHIGYVLQVNVATEGSPISPKEWIHYSSLGEFPFKFESISIDSVDNRKKGFNPIVNLMLNAVKDETSDDRFQISWHPNGIEILNISDTDIDTWTLGGKLSVSIPEGSDALQLLISIESLGGEGGVQ